MSYWYEQYKETKAELDKRTWALIKALSVMNVAKEAIEEGGDVTKKWPGLVRMLEADIEVIYEAMPHLRKEK